MSRHKPFVYDAIETDAVVIFFIDHKGGDNRTATGMHESSKGLQVIRADGTVLRFINLHPRLSAAMKEKPVFIAEIGPHEFHHYPAHEKFCPADGIAQFFEAPFYWYIGPEATRLSHFTERPLPRLIGTILKRPVSVSPGQLGTGPTIGLSYATSSFVPLTRGRDWIRVNGNLIVDAGLIAGTAGGYPAGENIVGSVIAAHKDEQPAPKTAISGSWSSQLAIAFPPAEASSETKSLEDPQLTV